MRRCPRSMRCPGNRVTELIENCFFEGTEMKNRKTGVVLALGWMVVMPVAWAEGPDTSAIMGEIQSKYEQAIDDADSSRKRHKLSEDRDRQMQRMSEALSQYKGSSSSGGSGASDSPKNRSRGDRSASDSPSESSGSGRGFYEFIRYRHDDPFLFCTDGQDRDIAPDRCWWPIAPFTGAFTMNPACRPPNPYGKEWTAADWDSLYQYLKICPQAGGKSGTWRSKNGEQPNMVPFKH